MIALEDCIGLCDLTAEEIAAIAEHEHVPEISAAALADYLMHDANGALAVRAMIRDDIRAAIAAGDGRHARQLVHTYAQFVRRRPEAMTG